MTSSNNTLLQASRNGKLEIEGATDDQARQCARILRDAQRHDGSTTTTSTIKSIELRRGSITSVGAGFLAKALKGNSTLRHLGLQGNDEIGDAGAKAIGMATEVNYQSCVLTYLDLSSTGLTLMGMRDLVQGVAKLQNLHTLCVNDNNLAQEAGHQLSTLFRTSASLHTLQAAGNYLGDRGLAALCGAWCHIRPVRTVSLDISSNGVGDLGMQWLTKGISALCRQKESGTLSSSSTSRPSAGIRDLRLRGNNITHAGAKELAKLLSEDRCARELRELDLSLNTITNEGFDPLASSLKGCRSLVRLNVAGCRLGPSGVKTVAKLLSDSPPRLSKIDVTPKTEFADRVLSDRGGLAVAMCEALQLVADALPFASTVVELALGVYSRADHVAADAIERTLSEHKKLMEGGTGDDGGGEATAFGGAECAGAAMMNKGGGRTDVVGSKEKSLRGGSRSGSSVSGTGRRAHLESGATSSRRGGDTPPPTQRSAPVRSRERLGTTRSSGIERPKAGLERTRSGLERTKAGAAERTRRTPGGGVGQGSDSCLSAAGVSATPPPGPRSMSRTSSKGSVKSSSSVGRSQKSAVGSTPATLTARDRAAPAVSAAAAAAELPSAPHHRRMHQGEELDSIDGFSPIPTALASHRTTPSAATSSRRHPTSGSGGNGSRGTGSKRTPIPSPPPSSKNSARAATPTAKQSDVSISSSSRVLAGTGSAGRGLSTVANVVSEVMGDTAAMDDYPESPPPVAPSTWQDDSRDVVDPDTPLQQQQHQRLVTSSPSYSPSVSAAVEASPPPPGPSIPLPAHHVGDGSSGDRLSRKLLRKTSSSSSIKENDEPELVEGAASLALAADKPESRSLSRSVSGETRVVCAQETALEPSTPSGAGAQQMISLAQAGQLLGPIVAKEVAKETRRLEVKFQHDLTTALAKVRLEMQSIDREGLVARVALEKRVSSSVRRLVDKLDQLERRFSRMEREDQKRKRLEAGAVAGGGADGAGTGHNNARALTVAGSTPPRPRRAAAPALPLPPPGGVGAGSTAVADEWWAVGGAREAEGIVGGEDGPPRSRRGGGGGASVVPESARPALADAGVLGVSAGNGAQAEERGMVESGDDGLESGVVTSEEEFMDSCDEAEAEMVRRLEEKMAALEGKLKGHEERQRSDYRIGVEDDAFGQGSAVLA